MTFEQLMKKLEKEMKSRDRGEWVNSLGKRRWFPKHFSREYVEINNVETIKDLYKTIYMASLEEAIKVALVLRPKQAKIPVYELAKFFDDLSEFLFGTEQHEGAYSALVRKLAAENMLNEVDIPDLIVSAESMYLGGYRIKKKQGKYVLLKPDFSVFMVLRTVEANIVKDEFYEETLEDFMKGIEGEKERTAVEFILHPVTQSEKKVFRPPSVEYGNIVGLSDFLKRHPQRNFEFAKIDEFWSKALFKESRRKLLAVSYRGKIEANYFRMLLDLLENAILNWFEEEYGFMFVETYPHVFITGMDGYPVVKFYLINNRLSEDLIDYYPMSMREFYSRLKKELSEEYLYQFRREFSDYLMLKLALGKNEILPIEQKVDVALRKVYNFMHIKNEIFGKRGYDYRVMPKVKDGTSMILTRGEIIDMANRLLTSGVLNVDDARYFGAEIIKLNDEKGFENWADTVTIGNIPVEMLSLATSFKLVGRQLLDKEADVGDNVLAQMVSASGLPEYDVGTVQLKNRIALMALLARLGAE